ncbi:amidase NDAI_0A04010 [Naumovozyma dairenensis CBS 421]|uniref:CN hydrolase domain-containing protein n=1 Tax=Naumovozyma dairenensis (strain ATCC 10597 / BCRC 20456 / CBS 421 / NBRC 0211 / NRRL Y-12639) TaxID=1071378 RepID=G0W420_NAUDC|nr:hypothetical protein NDAI_0A04010 [Naumovozyma dairenensis CBS 421]CCD22558.1 hypothetical protein NDAI_0A04010 [Naumovozyma dairenensis CBS 421]
MTTKSKVLVDLKIALVQLNSQVNQVTQNINRTWSLLNKFKEKTHKTPDIIVFPEFALTGYNFHSRDHIFPFCSLTKESESFKLAKQVSKLFNCYTVIGYPERTSTNNIDDGEPLYNSALVTSPQGNLIFNYRKSFLYQTDHDWHCHENPMGFQTFPLTFKQPNGKPDITINTSIGICMDLSPYEFEAPFIDFEFASYNLDMGTELIICPMAWLHSSSITDKSLSIIEKNEKKLEILQNLRKLDLPPYGSQNDFQFDLEKHTQKFKSLESDDYSRMDEPDLSNVDYWIRRFLPFLDLDHRTHWFQTDLIEKVLNGKDEEFLQHCPTKKSFMGARTDIPWAFKGKNMIMVNANRCGVEDGTTVFAGSSGIYKFNGKMEPGELKDNSKNHSVELLGNLGKGLEGIIMREVLFQVER